MRKLKFFDFNLYKISHKDLKKPLIKFAYQLDYSNKENSIELVKDVKFGIKNLTNDIVRQVAGVPGYHEANEHQQKRIDELSRKFDNSKVQELYLVFVLTNNESLWECIETGFYRIPVNWFDHEESNITNDPKIRQLVIEYELTNLGFSQFKIIKIDGESIYLSLPVNEVSSLEIEVPLHEVGPKGIDELSIQV